MKELVVISGKGGTGKTSITACLAALAGNSILCDADVDAADLHLLLAPDVIQENDFTGGGVAEIMADACTQCGICRDLCRFEAISADFKVDDIACEGCGVCVYFCPEKAIRFETKTCGQWFVSETRLGPMVHARLGIAEENSGKLVTLVRQQAKVVGESKGLDLIVTDGPPGIGCPVIASLGGATAVLIITEPTVSGLHDLERVAQLTRHFKVPAMVCINKYDLNPEQTDNIKEFADAHQMMVAGQIPFDRRFVEAMIARQTLLEFDPGGKAADAVRKIWEKIDYQYIRQEA